MDVKRIFLVSVLILVLAAGSAFAGCSMDEKVVSDNYAERAGSRLLCGLVNAGLGWTQIFVEPRQSVKYDDQNIVDGIFDGFGGAVYYSVLGVWDLGTFWFPGSGGKDIAAKDCVLETFKRGEKA
ncbi:MAG: hypothetical protein NC930_08200 [Candidatus Omnitrophica bacterium]|nr:hypothetical protein [Candidatus Omnitrophota bacterium]